MLLNIYPQQFLKVNKLLFVICLILVSGIFFSKAVISVSAILIFCCGIYQAKKPKTVSVTFLLFPFLYLVLLLSFFYTQEQQTWQELMLQDAPMLLMSVGFMYSQPLNNKQIKQVLLFFAGLCFIILCLTAMQVLADYQTWIKAFSLSKNIASISGIPHNRFGFLCVAAFIVLLDFYRKEPLKARKYLYLAGSIIMFCAVHIIAYRFALALMYIVGAVFFLKFGNYPQNIWMRLGSLILVILSIMWVLFNLNTGFKARITDTIEDLNVVVKEKNANNYSISQRWAAIQCATEIIKKSPYIGTGTADLNKAMQKQYEEYSYWLIPQNRIFIHNQYLYLSVGFGIPMAVIFFMAFAVVIYLKDNFIFSVSMLTALAHMLIENSLQMQVILATILLWYGIFPDKKRLTFKAVIN